MKMVNQFLDKDNDKKISKEEYTDDNSDATMYRNYLFQNISFEFLDVNKDGFITVEDICILRSGFYKI